MSHGENCWLYKGLQKAEKKRNLEVVCFERQRTSILLEMAVMEGGRDADTLSFASSISLSGPVLHYSCYICFKSVNS